MRFMAWIFGNLLGAAVLLVAPTAFADTTECVPKSEMAEIAQHFSQFRHLANRDYCMDGSETSNLIAGIMFMRKTAFAENMPKSSDEMFSGDFASSWYDYFIGRITDFNVQRSCPKGVGAYVYMFGTTMYVCPFLLSANFTALDRASVFMHEARHIDGFPHTTCSSGPRAGLQGACDYRISDGGSYAVTVETYAQIARYATELHPALKAYSRAAAVIYADEAFDTPTRVHREPKLLMMAEDKGFHMMDVASLQTEAMGTSPLLGNIVMRAQHMILFPEDKTQDAKYVFAYNEGDIAQAAGDLAIEYNKSTPTQRANIKGVHIAGQWSAVVSSDSVKFMCDPRGDSSNVVSLNGEVAANLLYPTGYNRASRTIHLATESGKIFELSCARAGGRGEVKPSNLSFDRAFKRIYKIANTTFGLGADGKLYKIHGTTSELVAANVPEAIHEIAPREAFEFFDAH